MTAGEIALLTGLLLNALAVWYGGIRASTAATAAATVVSETNEQIDRSAKSVGNRLDVIHTLVNSNMTKVLEALLEAKQAQLAALIELSEMKTAAGGKPSAEAIAAIRVLQSKVVDIRTDIADRHEASEQAAVQTAEQQEKL